MKLLVVCPRAFVSGWGADTPRLLQMARGLSQLGWQVELLRCKHPDDARFQDVIQAFPGRVVTAPFFGPFSNLMNRPGLRRAQRTWWRLTGEIEQSDYPDLTAARFSKQVKNFQITKPDVIFGITTGQLESFASAAELSAQFGAPLALEYRDPLPHPGSPPLDPAQTTLLQRCIAQASLVITTTEGLSASIERQFPAAVGRVRTIYSCYDDEFVSESVRAPESDRLILLHAGALHGGKRRNARSLVKGIAEAAETEPASRGKILLRLVGAAEGGREALRLAQDLQIPSAVELLPQMSHKDCLAQMDAAHVLVVIKFDDVEYDLQVPGKTFQYLGRGKPVLGIMRETEAARILRPSGIAVVLEHSDIAGTSAALLDLWRHRNELSSKFKPNWDHIRQFSLTTMSKNFHRELSALVSPIESNLNGHARGERATVPLRN